MFSTLLAPMARIVTVCTLLAALLFLAPSSFNTSNSSAYAQTSASPSQATAIIPEAIVVTYLKIGEMIYADTLAMAKKLQSDIHALLDQPSTETLEQARKTYRAARLPYQRSEAFRFSNPEVDDLEGRVNAWPMDEGLIDYVDLKSYSRDHPLARANIVASPTLTVGGKTLNFPTFDKKTLRTLHEIDGEEGHVATGYHVIEFLLWGQDLHGYKYGAGTRPYTDYHLNRCSNGSCERRRAYLIAVTALLIEDLAEMHGLFDAKKGELYRRVSAQPATQTLKDIFQGLASLAYGELAGERMQLGLLLNDPEEEHECFSDLTHLSHYGNVLGMEAIYYGRFNRASQKPPFISLSPSIAAFARRQAPKEAARIDSLFRSTRHHALKLYNAAEKGMSYDMMLDPKNAEGKAYIEAIVNAIKQQSYGFTELARALKIPGHLNVLGSESLDTPNAVLQPQE